jgi:hypothetical protein
MVFNASSFKWSATVAVLTCSLCSSQSLPTSTGSVPHDLANAKHRQIEVRFVKSSFADYLFYLLWRFTGDYPDLKTAVPLDEIATIDQAISLPEQAASDQVSGYGQIYSLLRQYQAARNRVERVSHERGRHYRILSYSKDLPSYEDLHAIVSRGDKSYSTFERYWQDHIALVDRGEKRGHFGG